MQQRKHPLPPLLQVNPIIAPNSNHKLRRTYQILKFKNQIKTLRAWLWILKVVTIVEIVLPILKRIMTTAKCRNISPKMFRQTNLPQLTKDVKLKLNKWIRKILRRKQQKKSMQLLQKKLYGNCIHKTMDKQFYKRK